jgi:hypothetical protein
MKRTALSVVVLLLLTPHASRAADPLEDFPDAVAAQTLFQEARALMRQRNYSDACPKLEESLRLEAGVGESGIGKQFDLADCNEQIGKLATAWAGFLAVASQSKQANQAEREKSARKRARALESRLPKLVIAVPSAEQGLEVRRDGIALDAAGWGAVVHVDPGTHRVTATAPGKQPWLTMVQAKEGATTRVHVPRDLPATPVAAPAVPEVADPAPADPAPADPASALPDPAPAAPPEPSGTEARAAPSASDLAMEGLLQGRDATRRTLGWAVAGVRAIGIGLGTGFDMATVSTIVDGATLVGGLVIELTTLKPQDRRERTARR